MTRPPRTSALRLVSLLIASGLAVSLLSTSAAAQSTAGAARAAAPELQAKPTDDLPIRRITMYRSGVGYFERSGGVEGDAHVQLRFKTEQINDILKSMVLLDLDGGRIDAVSYGSKEPLERRLASFGVNIAANPSMADLLNQLRGAPVRVVAGGQQISGTILGIENRQVPVGGGGGKDGGTYSAPHLNLVTPGGLKSIAIADISSYEILDKELAGELDKALAALAEYRADRSKTVDLNFAGKGTTGQRRVVVGYVHEMPVWKTSYRLILPDESAPRPGTSEDQKTGRSPSTLNLKGWAIVENNTDQDWNEVRLSLVSGRPVSFQMDLYEPLFVSRPLIPVPVIPGVAPRAYSAGMEGSLAERLNKEVAATKDIEKYADKRAAGARFRAAEPAALASAKALVPGDSTVDFGNIPLSGDDFANYSAAAQAQAGEIGEVFQYELESPVTIERQRSAMIPFLSAPISGRRVSIYSASDGADHPMRGVELTNDSKLQLLPGPISVFDGSDNRTAYAGDAQIGHIAPTDKRLLAYAIDLDVNVLTTASTTSTLTHLKIVDGMFEQTLKSQNSMSYAFDNKDAKRSRALIIEHPRLAGWTLIRPEKALEETQSLYRFELPVAPGKKETLSVVQERVESQKIGITSFDLPTLTTYFKDGKVSAKVIDTMKEVGKRQGQINDSQRQIADLDKQTAEISTDQTRIRQNMAGIDKSSQLYTRYMAKLTDQETKLEDLTDRKARAQAELLKLQNDLNEYLRTLNVE